MNFLKTKVFKNDETSVTWGRLLLIAGGLLVGLAALTGIVLWVFKYFCFQEIHVFKLGV